MTDTQEVDFQDESPETSSNETVAEPDAESGAPLSRDIVSKIVERERKKAFEKGQKEMRMQLENERQETLGAQNVQAAPPSLGGMQQLSPQEIEKMIAEKAPQVFQEHVQKAQHEQMVNSFVAKMQAAEAKYPGLEAKLNELDYSSMGPIVQMANQMDNTGEIMKELVDNPEKLTNLITLSYVQPKLAAQRLAALSTSIKANQEALAEDADAREPMSQLKPSTSAGMDNSKMSVSDFRKMFR